MPPLVMGLIALATGFGLLAIRPVWRSMLRERGHTPPPSGEGFAIVVGVVAIACGVALIALQFLGVLP